MQITVKRYIDRNGKLFFEVEGAAAEVVADAADLRDARNSLPGEMLFVSIPADTERPWQERLKLAGHELIFV